MSPPFFFFNVPATTLLYVLSLHDALPIYHDLLLGEEQRLLHRGQLRQPDGADGRDGGDGDRGGLRPAAGRDRPDRKSTRLNSSHVSTSYAVFCLKKKTGQFQS